MYIRRLLDNFHQFHPSFRATQYSINNVYFIDSLTLQTNIPHQAYNMTTGRAGCRKELEKAPAFHLCQRVPGIEVDTYIEDCAKDAVVVTLSILGLVMR